MLNFNIEKVLLKDLQNRKDIVVKKAKGSTALGFKAVKLK